MAELQNISELVRAVFQSWNTAGVDFLVLRNYESLPNFTSNDVDILVNPQQLRLAEKELIRAARSVGFVLHNRAQFSPLSLFLYDPASRRQIQFDLFGVLRWRGLTLLPTQQVLAQKISRGDFFIPHPAHEAVLNLITRLLYQKRVKENYRAKIQTAFQSEPEAASELSANIFGKFLGQKLFKNATTGNWKAIETRASRLRQSLIFRELSRHPVRSFIAFTSDVVRLSRRLLHPPGLTVVFLGPDGCGKSSVIPKTIDDLRHTFSPEKGLQIHWKPSVFFSKRRRGRPPTTNPHAQTPRNVLSSLLFLVCHWLEFFFGYWVQIRPVRFRNGLVSIDRYYYDFLVDPRRYRLNTPHSAVRLGEFFLPKPDLVFLLDAPAEVLQARKQEVPIEETARQRQAFLDLATRLPNARIIDATRPIECVAADVVRSILKFGADRMSERGKGLDE